MNGCNDLPGEQHEIVFHIAGCCDGRSRGSGSGGSDNVDAANTDDVSRNSAVPVVVYAFRRVPELALALFLYAGFFKQAVPMPIDVTLLLASATMMLAVYL